MLFYLRKRDSEGQDAADWASRFEHSEERRELFLMTARALIQCIQEFVIDNQEMNSAGFKGVLAEFAEILGSEEKTRRLPSICKSRTAGIGAFAQRQKDYLRDRETEFRDIIDILSKAMAALDLENRAYNRSVLEQGQRLEDISLLDDIKRIKQAMRQEVEQLREAVREKELRDSAKIEKLSRKVSVLNHELQSARSESEHDGLTGILNRRTFDRLLGDLVARNTVTPQEFALLMIDIDNFKHINDTFGHLAGDGVIVGIVNKLRQSIRSEDMLARYGGEEFVIILPGASLRNAMKKARKVCEAVAAKRYVLEGVPASQMFELTVSIGVSAWRPGDTVSSVVERADQALYLAKRSGKNRAESEKSLKHCT